MLFPSNFCSETERGFFTDQGGDPEKILSHRPTLKVPTKIVSSLSEILGGLSISILLHSEQGQDKFDKIPF
jgi:hypothetical protein